MGVREVIKYIVGLDAFRLIQPAYDEIDWCLDEDQSKPHIKNYMISPYDDDDDVDIEPRWVEIRFNKSCDHCIGIVDINNGVERQLEIEPPAIKELTDKEIELVFRDKSTIILDKSWGDWKIITPDYWMVLTNFFGTDVFIVPPKKVDGYHRVIVAPRITLFEGGPYHVFDYDRYGDLVREIKVDRYNKIIQAKIDFTDKFDIERFL